MPVRIEGFSGGDRTSLDLPAVQQALMEKVVAAAEGKPVVLLLLNGSALAINWADQNVPAIVEAWYPGQAAGTAVADVLFGDVSPAGRLPVTFYRSLDQLPPFDDYAMKGRTYRYFTGAPLYPFGHGLSYSSFAYARLAVPRTAAVGAPVAVSVEVRNSGTMAADEVVQLYVTDVEASGPVPLRALKGFQRISLAPGGKRVVRFTLDDRAFSLVGNDGRRIVEPGRFTVAVGGGSRGCGAPPPRPMVSPPTSSSRLGRPSRRREARKEGHGSSPSPRRLGRRPRGGAGLAGRDGRPIRGPHGSGRDGTDAREGGRGRREPRPCPRGHRPGRPRAVRGGGPTGVPRPRLDVPRGGQERPSHPGPVERRARGGGARGPPLGGGRPDRARRGQTAGTAVLLDDQGRVLKHRKIHELDITWHLRSGTVLRWRRPSAASASRSRRQLDRLHRARSRLGRMGARLLLSPCAWAVTRDHDNAKEPYGRDLWDVAYRLFAEKQRIATVAVSNVGRMEAGPWKGRYCIGSSLAVGPDGAVLARLPYGVDAEAFRAIDVPSRLSPSAGQD
jgi:hypothetical protein